MGTLPIKHGLCYVPRKEAYHAYYFLNLFSTGPPASTVIHRLIATWAILTKALNLYILLL
jgi:hypothetical protein